MHTPKDPQEPFQISNIIFRSEFKSIPWKNDPVEILAKSNLSPMLMPILAVSKFNRNPIQNPMINVIETFSHDYYANPGNEICISSQPMQV